MNLAEASLPFRFTTQNAAEMSRRGWAARRERDRIQAEQAEAGRLAASRNVTPESIELAEELKRIKELISDTRDADKLQKLSATYARLFNAWQTLTGTPKPPTARMRKRADLDLSPAAPIGPAQPLVSSTPNPTTTGGGV